ncbi:MAG TPA: extracellular solute-binding protein [Anaerolineales bacterium]|nr:extracellular solute-binding protein [Anaerolineales bacterium]
MQHVSRKLFGLLFVLALLVSACGGGTAVPGENAPAVESNSPVENEAGVSGDLVIYSGRSESLIQPVLDAFQAKYPNVKILLKSGSNSELANALIEEQANPQADVFVTTEIFTIQSLYQQGLFASYRPVGAELLPAEFIGPEDSWVGLTRRTRIIMYNTELVSAEEAPQSIFDLTDPKWQGQIAAAGSTNGGMQAHIAAMRQLLGDVDTQEWLVGLMANDVTFFGGHTDVRKAVGAGEFKIGLVNHYYYYLQLAEGSPVGIVFPDQGEGQIGLISNATSAAIVKGGKNVTAAQAFLDFLISEEGQKLFAEGNYEYPMLAGVTLREGVEPLENFRLADVNVAEAALDLNGTLDLMEAIGLP